jgi:hypothetical protein
MSTRTIPLDDLPPNLIRVIVRIAREVRRGPRAYRLANSTQETAIRALHARGKVAFERRGTLLHAWWVGPTGGRA